MNETAGKAAMFSIGRSKETLRRDFEAVALPHLNQLYRAAFYLTRNEAKAEDLNQDTYLRAYRCFYQFQPGTNCRAWLLTILRSLFLNNYDRKKRHPEVLDWGQIDRTYEIMIDQSNQARAESNSETLLLSQVTVPQVGLALKALPEEYRTAIVLVDVEDLTYEETARIMDCPVGTVRSRVSRGRRLLQVALREYAVERGLIKDSTQKVTSEKD